MVLVRDRRVDNPTPGVDLHNQHDNRHLIQHRELLLWDKDRRGQEVRVAVFDTLRLVRGHGGVLIIFKVLADTRNSLHRDVWNVFTVRELLSELVHDGETKV